MAAQSMVVLLLRNLLARLCHDGLNLRQNKMTLARPWEEPVSKEGGSTLVVLERLEAKRNPNHRTWKDLKSTPFITARGQTTEVAFEHLSDLFSHHSVCPANFRDPGPGYKQKKPGTLHRSRAVTTREGRPKSCNTFSEKLITMENAETRR